MKERILSIIATGSGVGTTGLSIDSIIEQSTPIIAWIGLTVGTLLSFAMLLYWLKKLFK